jgi:hypothetical protein
LSWICRDTGQVLNQQVVIWIGYLFRANNALPFAWPDVGMPLLYPPHHFCIRGKVNPTNNNAIIISTTMMAFW